MREHGYLTKGKYSIFNWNFGRYKKIIAHSENCLLELDIQAGFSKFSEFWNRVGSISRDSTFKFPLSSIWIMEKPRTDKIMDFTPEVEDEVIRDALLHKLDKPLVNPSKKFWRDSTDI